MFITALGIAWLIGQQAGVGAMTVALYGALGLALGLALALWWAGVRQRQSRAIWPAMPAIALALIVAPFGVDAQHSVSAASSTSDVVPYSAARLERLQRQHRPVLLYATAAWCLTCKVNEASSLSSARIHAAFRQHGAVMMEADWTHNDPAVTRLLTANGRAGVPLYVWYPKSGDMRILPQVLTPGLIEGLLIS